MTENTAGVPSCLNVFYCLQPENVYGTEKEICNRAREREIYIYIEREREKERESAYRGTSLTAPPPLGPP